MRRVFTIILVLLWMAPLSLGATESSIEPNQGEEGDMESAPVIPPSGDQDYGKLFFFPAQVERPSEDRHKVEAGQKVPLCLKLRGPESVFLKDLKEKTTGFRLVLEDNEDPPNAILVTIGEKRQHLIEDEKGCLAGEFKIPSSTTPGVYQVADLILKDHSGNYYSFRDFLYGFSKADELEVVNPKEDPEAPELLEILSYGPAQKKMGKHGKRLRVKIHQMFIFKDTLSGIDPKSLKVFYRLTEDDRTVGFYLAKCRRSYVTKGRFSCRLKQARPEPIWDLRKVGLELDSLSIKDKGGNLLSLSSQASFEEKAKGTPIKFTFLEKKHGPPKDNPRVNQGRSRGESR